jgi:thiol:disulfide interchange protein
LANVLDRQKYMFKRFPHSGIYTVMNRIRAVLLALVLAGVAMSASAAATRATLLLSATSAKPGATITAAVRLEMSPGWHTYWKNGGDSGGPTQIEWRLPTGVSVGEIQWPTPEKYVVEGLTTYVYHDETILLVPLKLGTELAPGNHELKAEVSWLECEKLCVPGEQSVAASLTIGDKTETSDSAGLIEAARGKLPRDGAALKPRAQWDGQGKADERHLLLEWSGAADLADPEFFPEAHDAFEIATTSERVSASGGTKLRLTVKKLSGDWPKEFRGLLVGKQGGAGQGFALTVPISGGTTGANPTASTTMQTNVPVPGGLLLNLGLALLGGIILNLMPCVLPILSLKILAVVNQRGQAAAVARKHSLSYAAGVLVSFWVIAGLVVLGRLATWGEQFQDARFIVIVTVLMTLVALNLFGVFEFILPGRATGAAAELSAREGSGGAFFNGILAVILGASCVAPVLAGAIGWAVSQPPLVIVLTFTFIGLGLALPYVALTFFPTLQKLLPRPGAWMEKFKIAMGFPMLATAAWLFSLLPGHYGRAGVLWVGLFLVLLAAAAWILGAFVQRGSRGKPFAYVCALGCLGAGYAFALEHKLDWRHPNYAELAAPIDAAASGIAWQPWSATAVAEAQASGRPVLVDFTADWCLTCQANKSSSLDMDSVQQKLKEINAVALLGDYTKKSPAIRDELKRFGRAGVPLVLVYSRNATAPPELLPTLLTPGIVLDALDRAAK